MRDTKCRQCGDMWTAEELDPIDHTCRSCERRWHCVLCQSGGIRRLLVNIITGIECYCQRKD